MKLSNRLLIAVSAAIILFSAGVFIRTHLIIDHTLIDDAYITYRYAANFAEGDGLVYNHGERILGTTTPGYAVLLGMGGAVLGTDQIPRISTAINLLAILVFAGCGVLIAYDLTHNPLMAAGAATLILLNYNTTYASIAGMEISLFLALLGIGFVGVVKKWWLVAAVFIGLLPLLRPEGWFMVGLFGLNLLWLWRTEKWQFRRVMQVGIITLLPGLLMLILTTLYYGSPIPQSIISKRAGLYPVPVGDTIELIMQHLNRVFNLGIALEEERLVTTWPIYIGIVVLFVGSTYWLVRKDRSLWMLPALLAILLAFFATSQTLIFEHYYALFETLNVICWWIALYALLEFLTQIIMGRGDLLGRPDLSGRPYVAMLLAIATFIFVFIPQYDSIPWEEIRAGRVPLTAPDKRIQAYRVIAKAIEPDIPPDTVIAMPEIGELGFFLPDVNVMDTAGLVTPEAVDYFPIPLELRINERVGSIPPQMIKDLQPDMIITLDTFILRGLAEDPWLWEHYTPVAEVRGDWLPWYGSVIYVLARNDFAPQLDLQAAAEELSTLRL